MLSNYNDKLTRVKLRVKGEKLYIRGTFPHKTLIGINNQYDISTKLPTTKEGIKLAFSLAQKIESDLNFERFNWSDWDKKLTTLNNNNGIVTNQAIALYEQFYFESRKVTPGRLESFKIDYKYPFERLPRDCILTGEILRKCLIETTPDSRERIRFYTAYSSLAKYFNIQLPNDWKKLRGNYEPSSHRKIPTDLEIIELRETFKNKAWQWVFGMLAVYGLRPHEVFLTDCVSDFPNIYVLKGKTKDRKVYPLFKQWAFDWQLDQVIMPAINLNATHKTIGGSVSKYFYKNQVGIVPYALRDRYAIRCAENGIDVAIAARLMGHNISTHVKHYQRFIDDIAMKKIMGKVEENLIK